MPVTTDGALVSCAKSMSATEYYYYCMLHNVNRLSENSVNIIKNLNDELYIKIKKIDEFISSAKKMRQIPGSTEKTSLNKILKSTEVKPEHKIQIAKLDPRWEESDDTGRQQLINSIDSYPTFHSFSKCRFR